MTGERFQDPTLSRDGRRVLVTNLSTYYVLDLGTGARVRRIGHPQGERRYVSSPSSRSG
jgi:hypothetical protein